MHRRLLGPVIERLEGSRGPYIAAVGEALEGDPRIQKFANLAFFLLARAAPHLPVQMPKVELIGRLIAFVERNQHRLIRTVYDPAFIKDSDLVMPVVEEFVQEMTLHVLKRYDAGELEEDGGRVYRVSWPFDPADFPYTDPDDEDDG